MVVVVGAGVFGGDGATGGRLWFFGLSWAWITCIKDRAATMDKKRTQLNMAVGLLLVKLGIIAKKKIFGPKLQTVEKATKCVQMSK
jgi:hypothetical protein